MNLFKKYIITSLIVCLGINSEANNLTIDLNQIRSSNDSVFVELAVSWENSWTFESSGLNHDAVWVHCKALQNSNWSTVYPVGVLSDDFEIKESELNTGILLKPNPLSSGVIELSFLNSGIDQFHFGGIEMVYVDSGAFYIGDSISTHSFCGDFDRPLYIENENILLNNIDIKSLTPASISGDIPAFYPKGTEAFYSMKYEISQFEMLDFLNHLNLEEQELFLNSIPDVGETVFHATARDNFNGIVVKQKNTSGSVVFGIDLNDNNQFNESDDGLDLASNFLSWKQLLMYLDGIGLRPMSELEFEKACRGYNRAVEREFSFGTDEIVDANVILNQFTSAENHGESVVGNAGIGAHGFLGRKGPLRVGFAGRSNSIRRTSGASYWGVMELSGNLWEQTVSVSKPNGLLFQGGHGDGDLSELPSDWKEEASIVRGGAWNSGIFGVFRDLAVSDRYYYSLALEIARNTTGGRGVISLKALK